MSSSQLSILCECTPVYDTRYERAHDETPTEAVVGALAAVNGTDPLDLNPLSEAIDAEALNRLFESRDEEAAESLVVVSFTIDGWNVFVSREGRIRVCDPDAPTDPAPAFERTAGD